jgi:DnaK suppressor protein
MAWKRFCDRCIQTTTARQELRNDASVDVQSQCQRRQPMPDESATLSREFIHAQRARLEALREQLLGAERRAQDNSREERADEPGDAGDEAQDAPAREVEQALQDADARRLSDVDRALQKIAEGTYGLSDASGKPIPKGRLEANPEAILTAQEARRAGAAIRS